jgi:hypothetical protein
MAFDPADGVLYYQQKWAGDMNRGSGLFSCIAITWHIFVMQVFTQCDTRYPI